MSILRRWFDPVRSKWFYNRPHHKQQLSIEQGLSLYLRLDDVYSYLAVQQIDDLEEILSEELKPIKIIICQYTATPPNNMTIERWQKYALEDAQILALQHRFSYDDVPEMPSPQALKQAYEILQRTPLQGQEFLYLLENIFHMLWQQQYGKLNMLYELCKNNQIIQDEQLHFSEQPILYAYFEFGGRKYHAVDDVLRLTRRLQQQKLLISPPIFMINHIEWREHLIHDAEDLHEIQSLQPELDLYLALEAPSSWFLLAYIQQELANLYNIKITIYPLAYQHRDAFDWDLAMRVSKRTQVDFTPFCRPDARATFAMTQAFYQVEPEQRVEFLMEVLQQVWTKGKDINQKNILQNILNNFEHISSITETEIYQQLDRNEKECDNFHQPDVPVMVLRVKDKQFVFNSLYRVWLIETIFSKILETIATNEYATRKKQG